jgi:hypothetical protein
VTASTLRLGIVSDLHYTPHPAPDLAYHGPFDVHGVLDRLETALDWFAGEHVDVLVLAGDVAEDGTPGSLRTVLLAVIDGWGGKAVVVPGNHDQQLREDALAGALRELGEPRLQGPSLEGWPSGPIRLAGVDAACPGEAPESWGDGCVVLISHFPLVSRAGAFAARGLLYPGDCPRVEQLGATLLARPAPTIVLNGHLHAPDTHREANLLQLTVGPLVEAPFEATIVEIWASATELNVTRRARGLRSGAASPSEERIAMRLGAANAAPAATRPGPSETQPTTPPSRRGLERL